MLALVSWILLIAQVKPRPAVEASGRDATNVIGHRIVAQFIALVRARPQLIASGPDGDADGVANSQRVNFAPAAVGVELKNAGAIRFLRVVGIVRGGANRDMHFLPIGRENETASPAAATAQEPASRNSRAKFFRRTARACRSPLR